LQFNSNRGAGDNLSKAPIGILQKKRLVVPIQLGRLLIKLYQNKTLKKYNHSFHMPLAKPLSNIDTQLVKIFLYIKFYQA